MVSARWACPAVGLRRASGPESTIAATKRTMHGKLYSSFDRVTKKHNGLTTLERKPPRNPKFANVKGTLDTGNSFSKVKLISNREYIRRRSEIFKRVRALTVQELIQENEEQHESINNLANGDDQAPLSPGSMVVVDAKADGDKFKKPYLILDCRTSQDDYQICHISTSKHYPADWLRHDRITPTLYHYKNRENKVIILYTLDDREGRLVARQFVEKGFDNVFLLTGGLEGFIKEFPQTVEGTLPDEAGMDDQLRASANKHTSRPPLGNSTYPPRTLHIFPRVIPITLTLAPRPYRSSLSLPPPFIRYQQKQIDSWQHCQGRLRYSG